MKKLSEKQFISVLDKVVCRHIEITRNDQRIDYELWKSFDWMTQSFCQTLWRLTESQDESLKEKLKIAVGVIIGNKTYTPRTFSTEVLTYEQFSVLLSEILKVYESNEFRRYQELKVNEMLDKCAHFLIGILIECLPGENVKSNIKIVFGRN